MKSVYCAVRTGSLNRSVCASFLKGYSVAFLFLALTVIRQFERQFLVTKYIDGGVSCALPAASDES